MKTLLLATALFLATLCYWLDSEARGHAHRHVLHRHPLTHRRVLSLMDINWPERCQKGLTAKDRELFDSLIRLGGHPISLEIEEFCET